jgi:uncharacterized integral membrane protein
MNESSPEPPASRRSGQGQLIAGAVLGGLAVLFAFLNLDKVLVHWIIGTWYTPLIVVILLCLVIGWILGLLTTWHRRRRR